MTIYNRRENANVIHNLTRSRSGFYLLQNTQKKFNKFALIQALTSVVTQETPTTTNAYVQISPNIFPATAFRRNKSFFRTNRLSAYFGKSQKITRKIEY